MPALAQAKSGPAPRPLRCPDGRHLARDPPVRRQPPVPPLARPGGGRQPEPGRQPAGGWQPVGQVEMRARWGAGGGGGCVGGWNSRECSL